MFFKTQCPLCFLVISSEVLINPQVPFRTHITHQHCFRNTTLSKMWLFLKSRVCNSSGNTTPLSLYRSTPFVLQVVSFSLAFDSECAANTLPCKFAVTSDLEDLGCTSRAQVENIPVKKGGYLAARVNAACFLSIPAVPSELFSSDVIKDDDYSVPLPMSLWERK